MEINYLLPTLFIVILMTGYFLYFNLTKHENVGLVAYYPFSGNASDKSGNGNHGKVHGATLTQDRFGNPNSAYKFDGQDDYIELPNNLNLIDTDFSISVFLKPNNYGKQSWTSSFCARTIISYRFRAHKNGDSMNSGFTVRLTQGRGCDGNNFFSGRFIDTSFQYNPITYQYTETNAYDWFHYLITRASDTMTIYLNGNEVARVAVSDQKIYMNPKQTHTTIGANLDRRNLVLLGAPQLCTLAFLRGIESPGFSLLWVMLLHKLDAPVFFPFDGVIDNIRIYNRALSSSEVQKLYRGK